MRLRRPPGTNPRSARRRQSGGSDRPALLRHVREHFGAVRQAVLEGPAQPLGEVVRAAEPESLRPGHQNGAVVAAERLGRRHAPPRRASPSSRPARRAGWRSAEPRLDAGLPLAVLIALRVPEGERRKSGEGRERLEVGVAEDPARVEHADAEDAERHTVRLQRCDRRGARSCDTPGGAPSPACARTPRERGAAFGATPARPRSAGNSKPITSGSRP